MPLDAASVKALVPKRDPDGHKGTFGTVVCVCGSLDYAGAALLCGTAAARAGAGVVVLAVPASLQELFAGRVPELVTLGLPEVADGTDIDAQESGHALKARQADALVVGCGLRESEGYRSLVTGLVERDGPPMVLDGGALNLLARSGSWWSGARRQCVLTPHPGEFARLTGAEVGSGDDERVERAVEAANRFGQVVVLKGARTVAANPDGTAVLSPFANAALATAGSGDVLAGTIGALIAQGLRPFDAACLGVYLHGRAGERLSEQYGDAGVLASELPRVIAFARHELVAQNP
jgi:ADP-dependent NAD(P)H-hydrate dehydratase / NAD(P)H-hydrate epimerase